MEMSWTLNQWAESLCKAGTESNSDVASCPCSNRYSVQREDPPNRSTSWCTIVGRKPTCLLTNLARLGPLITGNFNTPELGPWRSLQGQCRLAAQHWSCHVTFPHDFLLNCDENIGALRIWFSGSLNLPFGRYGRDTEEPEWHYSCRCADCRWKPLSAPMTFQKNNCNGILFHFQKVALNRPGISEGEQHTAFISYFLLY